MKEDKIKYIACSIDLNYYNHLFVMLTSLFLTNKKYNFYVFIIHNFNDEIHIQKIHEFFILSKNSFELIKLDDTLIKEDAIVSGHISLSAYYRIYLPKILPLHINKVLYVDVDIVVKKDLGILWEKSIDNQSHFAVEDKGFSDLYKQNILMENNSMYFNSGILFINLNYWRENNIFEKCIIFLKNYKNRIQLHDQDVLNSILCNQWKELPYAYNAQESIFRKDLPLYRNKNYLNAYFNPIIIHYTGGGHSKPWYKECRHDLKNEYAFYYYKSKMFNNPIWIRLFRIDFKLTFFTLPLVYFGRFNHQIKRLRLFFLKNNFLL